MSGPWHRAIAFALTGTDADFGVQDAPDPATLVAELAERGWDAERIAAHARDVPGTEPWPHPVPDALRAGLGAAQLHAAIGQARGRLGLEVLTVLPPSRRSRLTADERRLLGEVPPHHGPG